VPCDSAGTLFKDIGRDERQYPVVVMPRDRKPIRGKESLRRNAADARALPRLAQRPVQPPNSL
jgi:hypothetical protein